MFNLNLYGAFNFVSQEDERLLSVRRSPVENQSEFTRRFAFKVCNLAQTAVAVAGLLPGIIPG